MSKYILFLHEDPAVFAEMSPEEMQRIIGVYRTWKESLIAKGKLFEPSRKLKDEGGKRLSRRKERLVVADGPYTEAKDVLAGLFVIEAATYDEAVTIATGCPHLQYGEIEIREVDEGPAIAVR
jgi:hypothetical protein